NASLSVAGTQGPQVTLGYDPLNRLTSILRQVSSSGPSVSSTIAYDNANRVTTISHSSSQAGTLATYSYSQYDAADQLTRYTGPEGTLNYSYDNLGELTGVSGARSESYSYDVNGNRTMTGYATGTGNRLSSDGTYTYTYDDEGNTRTRTRLSD